MKLFSIILLFIGINYPVFAQNSGKEILIIGTMHEVPKIVKHSYKPLFKQGLKYNPDAIFIESPRADDDISWEYLKNGWSTAYKKFYLLSDSLKKNVQYNGKEHERLLKVPLENLTDENLKFLMQSYAQLRDFGNHAYYKYLLKYGLKGSKRPLRNEDGDLTYKLALQLRHKEVINMDDQQTNKEYHMAWTACLNLGAKNGDNDINQKLNKKDTRLAILPGLLGKLGKYNNSKKAIEIYHALNSYSYVKNKNEPCNLGTKYWNERNERIAQNILKEIHSRTNKKNLVVIGAGHVVGLIQALKAQDPNIPVRLVYEKS